LGAALDVLPGVLTLHDRCRPRTTANIDHLVVAPSGVWVIDAKHYAGVLGKADKGGWFRSDIHLMVGGSDRTKLVEGVHKQVADVRRVLESSSMPDVPVRGV